MTFKDQHFFIISWRFLTAPVWNVTCSKSACSESGWKHKESGDFSVAVSARSNHRINHDWFRFCRNLQLSSASGQRLAQFGPEKQQGWWLGGPMSVAVCLCAVNLCSSVLYLCPHGQCQPQSHVQSWPLRGGDAVLLTHVWGYFYSSGGEQCSAPSPNCLLWF